MSSTTFRDNDALEFNVDQLEKNTEQSINNMKASQMLFKQAFEAAVKYEKAYYQINQARAELLQAYTKLEDMTRNAGPPVLRVGQHIKNGVAAFEKWHKIHEGLPPLIGREIVAPLKIITEDGLRELNHVVKEVNNSLRTSIENVKRARKEVSKSDRKGVRGFTQQRAIEELHSALLELCDKRKDALDKVLDHESARYRLALDGLIHWGKAAGTLADATEYVDEFVDNYDMGQPEGGGGGGGGNTNSRNDNRPPNRMRPADEVLGGPEAPMPLSQPSPSQQRPSGPAASSGNGSRRPSHVSGADKAGGAGAPRSGRGSGEALDTDEYIVAYDFKPSDDTQLFLVAGDRVRLEGDPHGDWQYGYNYNSKSSGWFPRSFLEPKGVRSSGSAQGGGSNAPPPSRGAAVPPPGARPVQYHESMMRPGPGQYRVGNHY